MNDFSHFTFKGALPALLAAALIAGCGGSSGGSMLGNNVIPPPAGGPLATMTIKGAPGFVNTAGHTVYVFDADLANPGQSNCNSTCAQNWPPIAAPTGSLPAGWSTITRTDNSKQLAYQGRPLYTFINDVNPGDANGDNLNAFGGLWHVARPAASSPAPSMMPSVGPSGYPH